MTKDDGEEQDSGEGNGGKGTKERDRIMYKEKQERGRRRLLPGTRKGREKGEVFGGKEGRKEGVVVCVIVKRSTRRWACWASFFPFFHSHSHFNDDRSFTKISFGNDQSFPSLLCSTLIRQIFHSSRIFFFFCFSFSTSHCVLMSFLN